MDNTLLIIIISTIGVVIAVAAVGRWYAHFEIAEKAAARREVRRIENSSAADAFADPQLRALIICPGCGAAGQFDVRKVRGSGPDQCVCQVCATTWDAH